MDIRSTFLGLALCVFSLSAARNARAQEYAQRPPPAMYVAPLSQTTQPSYVPQSVALSGPREIEGTPGGTVPAGYTPVERTRKGLVIGGAVTLGALYFLSGLVASTGADNQETGRDNPVASLYIPVFGPFVQMAKADSATERYFLAIDGAGQLAGAIMLVAGLVSPKTIYVRNDLAIDIKRGLRVTF